MAYKITDECSLCSACVEVCPTGGITEGEDKFEIEAALCESCGACAEACPCEAISPGD